MLPKVAVVTDSSAMLPAGMAEEYSISVVPLQVVIDDASYAEGEPEAVPAAVTEALTARKRHVSTSRAAPAAMAEAYAELEAAGCQAIVSVHLSGAMSGTVESARVASREVSIPVTVVDTRAVGPAVGLSARAAAEAIDAGADAAKAGAGALERAEATRSFFYVDTLEYLRRGGRIGAAAALLGSALAVKPLLTIADGEVVLHERVRTASRALSRLEELCLEAVGDGPADVMVAHLGSPDRAGELAARIGERAANSLTPGSPSCGEVSAVLAVHVGPGMLAVVVAPAA